MVRIVLLSYSVLMKPNVFVEWDREFWTLRELGTQIIDPPTCRRVNALSIPTDHIIGDDINKIRL